MKTFDRFKDLIDGEGYCIGLFVPQTLDPQLARNIGSSYLSTALPSMIYYHQWMPESFCFCVSVGFPIPVTEERREDLVRETVAGWFRCLDACGIKGAASVVHEELRYKPDETFNHFIGRGMSVAIHWFDQLKVERSLFNAAGHILAMNPEAQKRLCLPLLPNTGADPNRSWALLGYGHYDEAVFLGRHRVIVP